MRPRVTAREGYDPILLDLDGTVIDSVALIRESHRHAVRTVLGEDWEDDRLVANVGRPLLEQMAAFSPERSEELYRVYREWNHANTAALLLAYAEIEDGAARAARRRPAGSASSPPRAATRSTSRGGSCRSLRELFDVVMAAEDSARHKPAPDPVLGALERLGASPEGACYVGDSPFDIESGRAAGVVTIGVTWGFFSPRRRSRRRPRPDRRRPRPSSCGPASGSGRRDDARRPRRRAPRADRRGQPRLLRPRPADGRRRGLRRLDARAGGARGGRPRAADARTRRPSGWARRRPGASPRCATAAPMLSLANARGAGGARGLVPARADGHGAGGARLPRGRVRRRAEDRRPGDLADLRGRPLRAGRHARRRRRGGGRHGQPAHDPRHPRAPARRRRRAAAGGGRGARRGLPAAAGLRRAQRGARGRRPADLRQPPQLGRRQPAPARPRRHRRAPALDLGLRRRPRRGARPADPVRRPGVAARRGLPREPRHPRRGDARGGAGRVRGLGGPARHGRLRHRRRGGKGRRGRRPGAPRAPWAARRAGRSPTSSPRPPPPRPSTTSRSTSAAPGRSSPSPCWSRSRSAGRRSSSRPSTTRRTSPARTCASATASSCSGPAT